MYAGAIYKSVCVLLGMSTCVPLVTAATEDIIGHVTVSTMYGKVRGIRTVVNNKTIVDKFLGIPYAMPPLGHLRFRPPEPPEPWTGVRNATAFSHKCTQWPDVYTSEDCLFLNVYTPRLAQYSGRLAVMLWIHGGSYLLGTGSVYGGSQLASKGVIVVTINYRLGALGFLSTEDDAALGNYGLLDCIRALEWVRDVISVFNGDPSNVTIFGQSAGGSMVSLLQSATRAKGLFHKAVMESGVSMSPFSVGLARSQLQPRPLEAAKNLSLELQCFSNDTFTMVDCLRRTNASEIAHTVYLMSLLSLSPKFLPFRPTVILDNTDSLLSVLPETALTQGRYADVPTIRGYTLNEWHSSLFEDAVSENALRDDLQTFLEKWGIIQPAFHTDIQQKIGQFMIDYVYRPGIHDSQGLIQASSKLSSDVLFVAPTLKEINLSIKGKITQPQYLYCFAYRIPNSLQPESFGVTHGDELQFLFDILPDVPAVYPHYNDSIPWTTPDYVLADKMQTMWSNFAKYGNPNPEPVRDVEWLPWTIESQVYLKIGKPLSMEPQPLLPPVAFPQSLPDFIDSQPPFDAPIG